nr:unnamed protein product [Callosobruchus chinensis]
MGEQRQTVSQALKNQDQRINAIQTSPKHPATSQKHVDEQLNQVKDHVTEMSRELRTGKRSLTAVTPPLFNRHGGVVAKPYPYNDKTPCDVYYLQFESIASMND